MDGWMDGWMDWDGISPDRSISRSPSGDKNHSAKNKCSFSPDPTPSSGVCMQWVLCNKGRLIAQNGFVHKSVIVQITTISRHI